MDNKITTIKLSVETVERLKAAGRMGDSYEDVIKRLLDQHEKKAHKS